MTLTPGTLFFHPFDPHDSWVVGEAPTCRSISSAPHGDEQHIGAGIAIGVALGAALGASIRRNDVRI
jgi:hypothetical protein